MQSAGDRLDDYSNPETGFLKRVYIIFALFIVAVVLMNSAHMACNYYSNIALRDRLRAEFQEWLDGLPRVPDNENGALPIVRGVELLDNLHDAYDFYYDYDFDFPDYDLSNAAHVKLLRDYVDKGENAAVLIEQGLGYEKWWYPVKYEDGYSAKVGMILSSKIAVYFYNAKGDLAIVDGNTSEAVENYLAALKIGNTLAGCPFLVSRLVEIACYQLGLNKIGRMRLNSGLDAENARVLLSEMLACYARRGDWQSACDGEYASFANTIADLIDGNTAGLGVLLSQEDVFKTALSKYCHDYSVDIDIYRKYMDLIRPADFTRYHEIPETLKDEGKLWYAAGLDIGSMESQGATITEILLPTFSGCIEIFSGSEALWRGAITLAAIRLFEVENGRLPGTLDEISERVGAEMLIDPFSGKRLVYRLEKGDFFLYSTNVDGRDDGAQSPLLKMRQKSSAIYNMDYVFHKPSAKATSAGGK